MAKKREEANVVVKMSSFLCLACEAFYKLYLQSASGNPLKPISLVLQFEVSLSFFIVSSYHCFLSFTLSLCSITLVSTM